MIVDAAIVGAVGFFAWRGVRRGLLSTLLGFSGFLVAAAGAVLGFRVLAVPLRGVGLSDGVANLVAAIAIFIGVIIGAGFAARTLTRALRWTKWGTLNAAAGGALSATWALAIVTTLLLALSVIPLSDRVEAQIESSTLAQGILTEAPGWVNTVARTDLRAMLRLFTPEERTVAIVATTDFRRASGAERALFDLLNADRRAAGLDEVVWDEVLARAARAHSADMYRLGFFSHLSPARGGTRDRLVLVGARYATAGENLVLAPTVSSAHAVLMGSVRHRDQILHPGYARVGIGAMWGPQGLLVTQDFAG